MKLTSRAKYAVAAMLDLALYSQGRSVALAEVARRQEIPPSYLKRLLARLAKCGLVNSQRGPGGGYTLAKLSEDISIADVIVAVDEAPDSTTSRQESQCCFTLTHGLWASLSRSVYDFLDGMSLARVIEEREALETKRCQVPSFEQSNGVSLQLGKGHFDGIQA